MAGPLSPRLPARRRLVFTALAAAVLLLHGALAEFVGSHLGEITSDAAMPPRIEVTYVRELQPAAPPVVAVAPAAQPAARQSRRPKPAESAPESVIAAAAPASEALIAEPPAPPEPAPELTMAERAALAQSQAPSAEGAAEVASDAASAPVPFAWPPSTRLSYALSGNMRGEVHGDAQVEWVREGARYQVHLDVTVGMSMAPLIVRRMSSEGELSSGGLVPRRYDEDTKVMFRDRRRLTLLFDTDAISMPDGRREPTWRGVQDTASQFVQLAWLFTTRPALLRPGNSVDLPLALPRRVDRWVYDVLGEEPVYTAFGEVAAFHLRPRRAARSGGDLVAEIWFAPTLRYLPVRIRIAQDESTFADLVLSRKPEIAAQ